MCPRPDTGYVCSRSIVTDRAKAAARVALNADLFHWIKSWAGEGSGRRPSNDSTGSNNLFDRRNWLSTRFEKDKDPAHVILFFFFLFIAITNFNSGTSSGTVVSRSMYLVGTFGGRDNWNLFKNYYIILFLENFLNLWILLNFSETKLYFRLFILFFDLYEFLINKINIFDNSTQGYMKRSYAIISISFLSISLINF